MPALKTVGIRLRFVVILTILLAAAIFNPYPLQSDIYEQSAGKSGTNGSCDLPPLLEPAGENQPMKSAKEIPQSQTSPPLDLEVPESVRTATFALG